MSDERFYCFPTHRHTRRPSEKGLLLQLDNMIEKLDEVADKIPADDQPWPFSALVEELWDLVHATLGAVSIACALGGLDPEAHRAFVEAKNRARGYYEEVR